MSIINQLIFDRTTRDLVDDTDKAYIDYNDLNRIEEACKYLADIFGVDIKTKTWVMSDFRTDVEMERIRANLSKLKQAYYSVPGMTSVPAKITYTTIKQANEIELILFELNQLYEDVQSGLRRFAFKLGTKSFGNRM